MFAGPFVEEIIFRKNIYTFIQNIAGVKCAVVFSALIFALYHCDIVIFLNMEFSQILAEIPLFFYGAWIGIYAGKDGRYSVSCVSSYDNKCYFAELRIHRINRNRLDR